MALEKETRKKLHAMNTRYEEIVTALAGEDAASDPEKLKTLGRELVKIEEPAQLYRQYCALENELAGCLSSLESETDEDMRTLYSDEIKRINGKLESVGESIDNYFRPSDETENRPVILEIRAGTGGNEAALFAGDLFRMYARYAEIKGWKHEMINSSPTSLGGFKEVIFSIRGAGAFSKLMYESGVHRVQRIPVTESGGRIHTSAATVAVLIEPDEIEVKTDPMDLRIDTFRSSGAGGQHVNKIESAIRITHLPTGLVVECQDERSQHQNRAKALRLLRARLLKKLEEEQNEKIARDRRSQVGSGDRSERIRTYNFPQNRVTDHRANITIYQLDTFVEGEMDSMLNPLARHMRELQSESA